MLVAIPAEPEMVPAFIHGSVFVKARFSGRCSASDKKYGNQGDQQYSFHNILLHVII